MKSWTLNNFGSTARETIAGFAALGLTIAYPIFCIIAMELADKGVGSWARISVGILALVGFLVLLRSLWRLFDRLDDLERAEARQKYRCIYRVLAFPTEDKRNIWQLQTIEVGDYGWEAKPLFNDGLIYLQGLTDEWGWVWRAGFRPDQIEFVGPKPVSQYRLEGL